MIRKEVETRKKSLPLSILSLPFFLLSSLSLSLQQASKQSITKGKQKFPRLDPPLDPFSVTS